MRRVYVKEDVCIGLQILFTGTEEGGIDAENHAMSTVIEYKNLIKFEGL